jgi:regulator of replication initiation timing
MNEAKYVETITGLQKRLDEVLKKNIELTTENNRLCAEVDKLNDRLTEIAVFDDYGDEDDCECGGACHDYEG